MMNSGFILAKQVKDIANAIQISLWVKTKDGNKKLSIDGELAVFFIETAYLDFATSLLKKQRVNLAKYSKLSLKTFNQQNVSGLYFHTLRDFYQARDLLKKSNVKCYEDDIRPDERYLMERFITADVDYIGHCYNSSSPIHNSPPAQLTQQNKLYGYENIDNVKCKSSALKSTVHLKMLSLDIECSMEGELYSIGLYSQDNLLDFSQHDNLPKTPYKHVLMIGDAPLHNESTKTQKVEEAEPLKISWLKDEKSLLEAFIHIVYKLDIDIFIGWNVINFDFRLLQKRCDLHKLKFCIGRDKSQVYWRSNRNNTDHHFIEIAGRVVLDGIDLLRSATYSFPSFSLDNVAQTLLGMGKKVDDVDNRVEEITENFNHDKIKLAKYNIEDCRLVWLIFEKTQLLEFAKLRSQLTGLAIDKIGGSVAAFTNLYLPKLHRFGYVAPNLGDGMSDLISPGGYVMDSTPGLYKNVLVLDFKSLYPSIIRSFKIDPLGLIQGLMHQKRASEQDKVSDTLAQLIIPGFDGALFSRQEHFLPKIIEKLWLERDKAKLQNNAALSQAIKIIMNSFYGILGSTGCRFFDPRLAGSITKRSHALLKTSTKWIENKGYKVIYGDTDSLFVHVGDDKSATECIKIGKLLQDYINEKWSKTLQQDYQIESFLEIEFETHFTQFLMPTIRGSEQGTKKRYAGLVANLDDQTQSPKLVFKGLESVRTDWTTLAKDFQQQLYLKVFNAEPVEAYINETVRLTREGQLDDKLVYRKRIRRKLIDYVKNVPPHVKAARSADEQNRKLGKPLQYQKRGWISYYMTTKGPQAVEHVQDPLDYEFYIERQLCAVADGILPFIGKDFKTITDKQLGLF
ncbi:MAG: DNA polymerase II [Colwellia sp.]